jgi:hypothetical protein
MRAWIANKLFDLARWVDWDTVQERCEYASIAADIVQRLRADLLKPETELVKPKRKRSSVGGARKMAGPKRPRGRPKGSKNKPKVQV